MMYDVHVVGGGPAGCFAGIGAAISGKKVLLSEEHRAIGQPEACSGLISKSGLESLAPYIDYRKVALNEISRARIISGGEEFSIEPKGEIAMLVSRQGLDELAAQRFEKEGGKIILGKKVTRNFEANSIIGADGPASSVADYFCFPKIKSFVAAMQGNFKFSSGDSHRTDVYLSAKEFPGFFGWVIPINEEQAKIGIGVSLPAHPLKFYKRFLSRLGVSSKPSYEFSAVIPAQVRAKTAMQQDGKSILLCGDAAGQVKATTGGGIFFSSQCGMIAGKNSDAPDEYERQWRKKYGLDLALHYRFRRLLDFAGGEPSSLSLFAAKALCFEDLLSERGEMDRWSRMLSPSILSSYIGIVARRVTGSRVE